MTEFTLTRMRGLRPRRYRWEARCFTAESWWAAYGLTRRSAAWRLQRCLP